MAESPRRRHARSSSDPPAYYAPVWPFLFREGAPSASPERSPERDAPGEAGDEPPGVRSPGRTARMDAVSGLMDLAGGRFAGPGGGAPSSSPPSGSPVPPAGYLAHHRNSADSLSPLQSLAAVSAQLAPRGRAGPARSSTGDALFSNIRFPTVATLPVAIAPRGTGTGTGTGRGKKGSSSPAAGSSPLGQGDPDGRGVLAKRMREDDAMRPRRTPSVSSFASFQSGADDFGPAAAVDRVASGSSIAREAVPAPGGLDVASLDISGRQSFPSGTGGNARPASYHSGSSRGDVPPPAPRTPYELLDRELAQLSPLLPPGPRARLLFGYAFGADRSAAGMADPGLDPREARWRAERAWDALGWWFGRAGGGGGGGGEGMEVDEDEEDLVQGLRWMAAQRPDVWGRGGEGPPGETMGGGQTMGVGQEGSQGTVGTPPGQGLPPRR